MRSDTNVPNVESPMPTILSKQLEGYPNGSPITGESITAVAGPSRSAPARRQLRARPSDPSPAHNSHGKRRKSDVGTALRQPTDKELEYIHSRLGPDHVISRREWVIKEKEGELKDVVDKHDTSVREKFHLERYISIFEGWNPKDAKSENSPVFLEYKRTNHNLLDLAPSIPPSQQAGTSRHRLSIPSRTTRRRATEQAELFAAEAPTATQHLSTPAEGTSKGKGKGKARASDAGAKVEDEEATHGAKVNGKTESVGDMPPPPLPVKTKGKGRRATINHAGVADEDTADEIVAQPAAIKKRGRPSLPNPSSKKLRNVQAELEEETASRSPSIAREDTPVVDAAPPTPLPPPVLPSLAHLPFPEPPYRGHQRPRGPRKVYYTDYYQLPQEKLRFDGDIESLLDSYIYLEDTGPLPDVNALELRAAREAYIRNRVNYLNQQGRLLRLLDEEEGNSTTTTAKPAAAMKGPNLPPRSTDFQDSLMSHMTQVRNAMLNEAKSKPIVCKRIAKMVQAHWDHIEGKEERERLAEERERKRQMKELTKSLRKRWALAVKVVRAKLQQIQKEEQDRLGKEHLQNMLQRSTGLIEAHRDEFAGREEEDDEDEDADSEGTDNVSSADDSEEGSDGEASVDQDETEQRFDQSVMSTNGDEQDLETMDAVDDQAIRESSAVNIDDGEEDGSEGSTQSGSDEASSGSEDAEADVDNRPSDLLALLGDGVNLDQASAPVHTDHDPSLETATPAPTHHEVTNNAIPNGEPDVLEPAATVESSTSIDQEISESKPGMVDGEGQTMPNGYLSPTEHMDATSELGMVTGDAAVLNGHHETKEDALDVAPQRAPSRRKRKVTTFGLANGLATPEEADPDAADIEFKVENTSDQDEKDRELDEAMEEADENGGTDDQANSEDEGLLADADLPIEELLKRYGYDMPNGKHDDPEANGIKADDVKMDTPVDQSLTDEALDQSAQSPSTIIEGKRQRRARAVWTPEDNPPPPPKKPKIETIGHEVSEEIEVESEASTPKFTSSEEEDEDEEDQDEADENMDVDVNGDGKEETDPNRLRPPFLLRGTLRPYQHDGLEWLASLYTNNMNGILADEMGLGKTIQTIALLAHLACDKGIWGQHLIIVPTSVILNWEMEFKKFLPGMKVLTYYGNQKERKEKRRGWQTQHHFQVCITSYQIVLADQHIFRRKNWVYMILDEAHNIKNFRSQRWQTLLGFKAQKRLLLTGTPLQNNLMELWSLLYFLMPGGVTEDRTSVVGFANHKEFTEWFSNPMDKAVESGEVIDEEMLATVNKLHTLLRPFILRRLKADVEKQLPGKFEHVVHCRLSKRQRFLYDEFMSRASTKEALTSGGYLGVVNTLMQLRKVCNHPDLFEVRPVRTSFAMDPVVVDYEPTELLVRKRLLARSSDDISLDGLNLLVTANEGLSAWACESRRSLDASDRLPHAMEPVLIGKRSRGPMPPKVDTLTIDGWLKYRAWHEEQKSISRWRSLRDVNRIRCAARPCYGSSFLDLVTKLPSPLQPATLPSIRAHPFGEHLPPASSLIRSYADRSTTLEPVVNLYAVIPPNVVARGMAQYALPGLTPSSHPRLTDPDFDTLHPSTVKLQIAFPDSSLLQYDCGKLQTLYTMLRDLKANGHRVLIFTQMTRVLDILEMFLSYNGHRYLRLDGSTKIEDRQIITERFNSDNRIFCFIASSRSGGVGINLTGADTVFFYDSDWNPSMDRQCMDRAHRIGQTREVHIYRFVSTHTVEENMLKKANQKRLLDKVVIQEGSFTTDFFGKMDWRDVIGADGDGNAPNESDAAQAKVQDIDLEDEPMAVDQDTLRPRVGEERELAKALAEVEDEEDAVAARLAQGESEMDLNEFEGENKKVVPKRVDFDPALEGSGTPVTPGPVGGSVAEGGDVDVDDENQEEEEEDAGIGSVDEYMLRLVEWDWAYFVKYRA